MAILSTRAHFQPSRHRLIGFRQVAEGGACRRVLHLVTDGSVFRCSHVMAPRLLANVVARPRAERAIGAAIALQRPRLQLREKLRVPRDLEKSAAMPGELPIKDEVYHPPL